jgi:Ser/Thr protein kinase RdoA (MazF antagonist)
MTVLPPHHSILAADALRDFVATNYDFARPVHCTLWIRGMNDVYVLRAGRERFALRAYRSGWHSADDIDYEVGLLNHLDRHGIPVAPPIRARDGTYRQRVTAAEGPRDLVLFRWVEGGAPLRDAPSPAVGRTAGEWIAKIHQLPSFTPAWVRRTDYVDLLGRELAPFLGLVHDPEQRRWCERAAGRLLDALSRSIGLLPAGVVHGDCHAGNVFVRTDGSMTLLDFDNAGVGARIEDLACLTWSAGFRGLPAAFIAAFRAGYESVRPLSPREVAALPLFVAARQQWWFGGTAANANAIGAGLILGGGLERQLAVFRRYLAEAGITTD